MKRCIYCLERVFDSVHERNLLAYMASKASESNHALALPNTSTAHFSLSPFANYKCFRPPLYGVECYVADK